MSYKKQFEFTKENIDIYLKEVAKEYRKRAGKKMPAEIILIGGASVLVNYGFRRMTTDIDALIQSTSAMKEAINYVGDSHGLPMGWLNEGFTNTDSYSEKLHQFSTHYRTYSNIVAIRTVESEYLIAMKLRSYRNYKNDMSDILGILAEHQKNGKPITIEQIRKAVINLYGDWNVLSESSINFIERAVRDGDYDKLYTQVLQIEKVTGELLSKFEQENPGVVKMSNVNEIARELYDKNGNLYREDRTSVLQRLQEKRQWLIGQAPKDLKNWRDDRICQSQTE